MVEFNDSYERKARRGLVDPGLKGPLKNGQQVDVDAEALFHGRLEHHLSRACGNGLARCLEELVESSLPNSLVDGSWLQARDNHQAKLLYAKSCRRAFQMQRAWPVGREIQTLLRDCQFQQVRGRALAVELAGMALRLSPSFQRRTALVRALHGRGRFAEANAAMASILSNPIAPRDRMQTWILQSSLCCDRGSYREAHVAGRAALCCDSNSPLAWCAWLLTAALTGSVRDLQIAGDGLAEVCSSNTAVVERFRTVHAGRYPQQLLHAEWLRGLPKVAQRILWEVFA